VVSLASEVTPATSPITVARTLVFVSDATDSSCGPTELGEPDRARLARREVPDGHSTRRGTVCELRPVAADRWLSAISDEGLTTGRDIEANHAQREVSRGVLRDQGEVHGA
jgi:hypothetical protein